MIHNESGSVCQIQHRPPAAQQPRCFPVVRNPTPVPGFGLGGATLNLALKCAASPFSGYPVWLFSCQGYLGLPGPSVLGLLLHGDPPAVRRLIVPIIVNTVNGQIVPVAVRHSPIPERREIMQPFIADGDTAPTVAVIVLMPFISASLLHTMPDAV